MVHSVGENRCGPVSHAVDGKMIDGANHVSAALVVAGTVEPFRAALTVRIDEVQTTGLLGFSGGVGDAHGHAAQRSYPQWTC